jgi:integrase
MAKTRRKQAPKVYKVGKVTLRKRNKTWHMDYHLPTGQRIQRTTQRTDIEAATRVASEIDAKLTSGQWRQIDARAHTFSELLDLWDENNTWSESTQKGTQGLRKKLCAEWGDYRLIQLTQAVLEGYLNRRMDEDKMGRGTYNRYLSAMRRIFDLAVRWNWLAVNPAKGIKMLREDQHVPEPLNDEQVDALLKYLPRRSWVLAVLLVDTGMRSSELRNLVWNDVDFETRRITVKKSKSGDWRSIPMTQRVHGLLAELRRERANLTVVEWRDIRKDVNKASAEAKEKQRIEIPHTTPHTFRHTFATRLLDRGVPLDRIQKLLGHKTILLTQRYARTRDEHLVDAIATLEDA